jgi:TPR repeat protein
MNFRLCSLLAAWGLAAILGTSASAGPLEDGYAAYRDQEFGKAAEIWQPLADKGDPTAQYLLGNLYADGKGVARDYAAAFKWFRLAADQGNAAAQYNVAASYAAGVGVPKSDVDAAKWFRRAADQGMPVAQLNLGLLHASGTGVAKDNVEALKWFEIAFRGLPAGGPRMDVARAMTDVSANMTEDEINDARRRARDWSPKPEGK